MVRRVLIVCCAVALLAMGCGDDDGGQATNPGDASGGAALVPEVVCVDNNSHVHFAYDNQGSTVVVLEAGSTRLSGTDESDEPFAPTVFAPGRVSPAFRAYPAGDPAAVVWELTGPDGTTRSTAADDDTPACTDELLTPTTPDPRSPALGIVSISLDSDTDEVTVEVELTGVPPESLCNPAFDAEPTDIRLEDHSGNTLADGTTVTLTEPVVDYQSIGRAAGFNVAARVVDRCDFEGTSFNSWPAGEFATLLDGPRLCISVVGTEPEAVDASCSDLAPTGGARTRG